MTDVFGLTQLPVQSPAASTDVVSDMLLQRLGAFLQAAFNRMGSTAWAVRCPGRTVVDHVFYHDPKVLFEENRLPALYLWSGDSAREQAADDVLKDTRTIHIYWVTEPGQEEHIIGRAPFQNAVNKMLITALHRERDPAWVVSGDTDPLAATQGSFLPTWLGYNSITRGASKELELILGDKDGDGRSKIYYGIATSVVVEELVTWGADYAEIAGLDAELAQSGRHAGDVYSPTGDTLIWRNQIVRIDGVAVTYG
jgi:hypothetical protein